MKIVAVTACITGIAHTYMAQAALEKEALKRGHEIHVETQGGMGIEDELEECDIESADAAILAIAIDIESEDRFQDLIDNNKVIEIDPSLVIKNPGRVFDELEKLYN
ncbi:PTS fructose transporter subunit IIB [uncultured Anaerococcus sp.]|uniref:PTS fructose transporter subunit IIB n=1 Tax=uncultured Anaerococcus sp. TaxID=293428 RepID=UPI0026384EEA|nr:fructose PTS transporter subunit IIB [uncultured Anaerococcus sp.]